MATNEREKKANVMVVGEEMIIVVQPSVPATRNAIIKKKRKKAVRGGATATAQI
jgi:hypothetical protein